eukprot:SAG31_NODE_6233_length_2108_cov_4.439522_2_plen_156_part_00
MVFTEQPATLEAIGVGTSGTGSADTSLLHGHPSDIFAEGSDGIVFDADGNRLVPQLHKDALILSLRVPETSPEEPPEVRAATAEGKASASTTSPMASQPLPPEQLAGFEAIATNEVIDLSRIGKRCYFLVFVPTIREIRDFYREMQRTNRESVIL